MNRFFVFGVLAMLLSAPAVWADEVDSLEPMVPESRTVTIDETTLKKGAMIGSSKGDVVIGVLPKSFSTAPVIEMLFQPIDRESVPENRQDIGWSVEFRWPEESELKKAIPVLFRVPEREYVPVIVRWDEARARWMELSTENRWKQGEAKVMIATVGNYALFYNTGRHFSGRATWYPDRLSKDSVIAAASNEYPLRTKLKVTNAETHESVIVRVVSVGPFVKGRIIDLTKSAFSKIGYPRKQGVLSVIVEEVK